MKKVLVLGSTVVDVIIDLVDHLPKTGEDVHVRSQHMSLGGCAYNVSDSVRHFQVPYILFSPVGTGVYGYFVREELKKRGISTPIPTPNQDNGCCYCFVESTGERTFISYHGAEYLFRREWFDLVPLDEIDTVYICGLEIEEVTGEAVIEFLEKHPGLNTFFAPGPRLTVINPRLTERLYSLSPILHLNETEALEASEKSTIHEAAAFLYEKTHNTVIITLGENGCYYFDGAKEELIPPVTTSQVDTIGAGDSHIGSVIACLKRGDTLTQAIEKANLVSSRVVATTGALLSDEEFSTLGLI
ncbi:MAG: PfkB family carbohydrate kinase [Eubacteriales bacterium]|nr:PfkB family carbohydrate kinase [Eubacteriales bacterium]